MKAEFMHLRRWSMLTILCALLVVGESHGQDENLPDGSLPEVVVEPEEDSLPEIDVSPDDDFSDADDSFDAGEFTYPSLAEQFTGGFDGGARGPEISLFDSPQAIDIITQQEIMEKSPTDIGAALEQTVGVMVQRTGRGQSSPYVRGLTGQQVLILVDGVRMTNATFRAGPNQYFNTIDPNMVERIEVIRGSGSVLYGADAIGGVINVVTKRSKLSSYDYASGSTVQRFSSADTGYTGRLNVEGSVGSLGFFAGGGYGNYNDLNIGSGANFPAGVTDPQGATSWGYNSGDIKLNYALSDCSELVFAYQHYMGEDIFRSDRNPAQRFEKFDPQQRELSYLRWQGHSDGAISTYQITGSYLLTRERRESVNPLGSTPTFDGFDDTQWGASAVLGSDLCEKGWLTYGVDWYRDEISNSPNQYPNDGFYERRAAFINWDVWLSEHVLLSAGGRYEYVEAGGTVNVTNPTPPPATFPAFINPNYDDLIGQIGLTVVLTDNLNWVAHVNQGFRAPNLDDLVSVNTSVFAGTQVPNPNLRPERSITYETGFKLNHECLRSEVYAWWTEIEDALLRTPVSTAPLVLEYTNAEASLYGVEYSGEFLFTSNWSVYGNAWYTFGQNTQADEPLSRIPPLQGVCGLRWRSDYGCNWLDVYTWLVDEQSRLASQDLQDTRRIPPGGTPGYGTLNLRAGHMIADCQRISIVGENLTDKFYRVHGSGSAGAGIGAIVSYELLR